MNNNRNILFVCSRNKWRSKTAETVFKEKTSWNIRSAGTSKMAVNKLTKSILSWADEVFVMEKKHKEIIEKKFGKYDREIIVLNIPDEYKYMDEELVEEFEQLISVTGKNKL